METNRVRICVPVCERRLDEFERKMVSAAAVGDIVELRLDCIEPQWLEGGFNDSVRMEELGRRVRELGRPSVATFRPAEQGGLRELDWGSRYMFWFHDYASDLLDIELDLCEIFSPPLEVKWQKTICSHHDFVGVPADLEQIYERMAGTPAHILKIAVRADDITDCLPLFRLLDRARLERREMVAIAMGSAGLATRILGPSRGAYLTYGALESETATAPGQPTANELRELYRIDQIDRQTEIMGLVGLPVGHSVSPHMLNAAFAATAVNGVYIPFAVRDLPGFIKRMVRPRTREIDWRLRGLSVTAPHKSAVIDHLDWIEPSASEIGAVNTIVIDDGGLLGYNTDATAILKPVNEKLGSLRDASCAVIGAGGAASAALWSLRNEGAKARLFARNEQKGSALAEKFGAGYERLDTAAFKKFDVVINATPLGTQGALAGDTAASAAQLRGARLAYDLVYNPSETLFLREARAVGCETVGGLSMLVLQAVEQFKLWTGVEAPEAVMREAAERAVAR